MAVTVGAVAYLYIGSSKVTDGNYDAFLLNMQSPDPKHQQADGSPLPTPAPSSSQDNGRGSICRLDVSSQGLTALDLDGYVSLEVGCRQRKAGRFAACACA